MARIVDEQQYNGFKDRVTRLGLTPLLDELRSVLTSVHVEVLEERDSNGAATLRKMLDGSFSKTTGWVQGHSGEIDWTKSLSLNGTRVTLGVEVQVSARSDLLIIDIIHLRDAIVEGRLDAGVIVVPSDKLSTFLTDRTPSMSDARRHIRAARVEDFPFLLLALEHDGPGRALPKQKKRRAR